MKRQDCVMLGRLGGGGCRQEVQSTLHPLRLGPESGMTCIERVQLLVAAPNIKGGPFARLAAVCARVRAMGKGVTAAMSRHPGPKLGERDPSHSPDHRAQLGQIHRAEVGQDLHVLREVPRAVHAAATEHTVRDPKPTPPGQDSRQCAVPLSARLGTPRARTHMCASSWTAVLVALDRRISARMDLLIPRWALST